MSRESPPTASVLSRIRDLLGLTGNEETLQHATLSLETLLRRTRRQLLASARHLGLTGIHRLTKDELARRFQQAMQMLGVSEEPETREPRDRPHKFDLGHPAEKAVEVDQIPWGYGQDRVGAMFLDPERLYVYWEMTDEAIERARAGLGPGGQGAWLNLRVYDVTNRIFDGTNAHNYFDHAVSRTDRQWFFFIGRPACTAVVELGLKSQEGYFVRVARSARVDFPRRDPAPPGGVEWLTVGTATGEIVDSAPDARPHPVVSHSPEIAAHVEPVRVWDIRRTHAGADGEWIIRDESFGTGWEAFEWRAEHRIDREGRVVRTSWEAGPFSYPVAVTPYVEEHHAGTVTVRFVDGKTHVVYGPWRVVIRGLGARAERRILARWDIHRSWVTDADPVAESATRTGRTSGASEQMVLGASERRWRMASELRLGGASEIHYLGASERRYLGASERFYAGASERRWLGASEWNYAGASELRYAGASERPRESWPGRPEDGARTSPAAVTPKR
jgi:hypothetical protein